MNDMDLKDKVSDLLELYINLICHQSTAIYESLEDHGNDKSEQDKLAEYELKIRELFEEAKELSSEYINLQENDLGIDYKKLNLHTDLMKKIRNIGINVANISRTIRDEWKNKEFDHYIKDAEKLNNEISKIDKMYKECLIQLEEGLERENNLKKENEVVSNSLSNLKKDVEIRVKRYEEEIDKIKQGYEEQLRAFSECNRDDEQKKEEYYKKGLETLRNKYKVTKELVAEKDISIKELKENMDELREETRRLRMENDALQKKSDEVINVKSVNMDLKKTIGDLKEIKLELQNCLLEIISMGTTKVEGNNIPDMANRILGLFSRVLKMKGHGEIANGLNQIIEGVVEIRDVLKTYLKEDKLRIILDKLEKIEDGL